MHLWNNFIFIFGGRGNNLQVLHDPKTYEVERVLGELNFITYDTKSIRDCPPNNTYAECYNVQITTFHNDIWAYGLDCWRWDDEGCKDSGWKVVDPGAKYGGCLIEAGEYLCTHPQERYDHISAVFPDGTLFIYGGYSQWCQDYCDDMHAISLDVCMGSSNASEPVPGDPACVWHPLGELGRTGPGERWRGTTAQDGDLLYLYGGHRLWHGFAATNQRENRWADTDNIPIGGYMDDLWVYRHSGAVSTAGVWEQLIPMEACYDSPSAVFEERFDIVCTIVWPNPRASASMIVLDGGLWLYGGFSSFYPYPDVDGAGAGKGVARNTRDLTGGKPYAKHPHYLQDMWRYDMATGIWKEVTPVGTAHPGPRRGHAMVLASNHIFMLVGGYAGNNYMADLWFYNVTTGAWLLKADQPHALYPKPCIEDIIIPSRYGQPTRGYPTDGLEGRSDHQIFVLQQGRQRPGWDGCRDRADGRTDLPAELLYERPRQRMNHRALWVEQENILLLYGGVVLDKEQAMSRDESHITHVQGDFWQWKQDRCLHNCSYHGDCYYGHCLCHEGYYGIDCSNVTCPGTFCKYNMSTFEQECTHCCHARAKHRSETYVSATDTSNAYLTASQTDDERYVLENQKVPCSASEQGESHGICNGLGVCQCRPPFVGSDCSVRDCPRNCTNHGFCSLEYPQSRCICEAGWDGVDCSFRSCLNNCSYPNGVCVKGGCECQDILNPFNRTLVWAQYAGMDCSYITPFAAAGHAPLSILIVIAIAALVAAGLAV